MRFLAFGAFFVVAVVALRWLFAMACAAEIEIDESLVSKLFMIIVMWMRYTCMCVCVPLSRSTFKLSAW